MSQKHIFKGFVLFFSLSIVVIAGFSEPTQTSRSIQDDKSNRTLNTALHSLDLEKKAAIKQAIDYFEESQEMIFDADAQEALIEEGMKNGLEVWIISILDKEHESYARIGETRTVIYNGEETLERTLSFRQLNNGPIITIAKATGEVISLEWQD